MPTEDLSEVWVAYARIPATSVGRADTFMHLFRQPGVMAGLQGVSWGPTVPGLFGRSRAWKITREVAIHGIYLLLEWIRLGLKDLCWVQVTYTFILFSVFPHIFSCQILGEEKPGGSLFFLWEPIANNTKEPCLKINSLDFDLCWGFFLTFLRHIILSLRNIDLTPDT